MVNGVNYDMINIGCPVQLSYQSSASGFNGTTVDDLDILWYDSSGSAIGIRLADGTSPPSRVLAGGNGVGNMHFSAPEQAMYTSTYDSTVKKWNKDFSSLTWSCNIGGNSVWMTRWSVVTPTDYIYAYKYVGEYSGELYKINKQTGVKTLMATNGSGYANIIGVESDGSVYLYNKYGDLTKFTDAGGVVFSISLSNGRSNPYSFDYAIITTDKIIVSDNDGQTYFNQTAIVNKQTGVVEKYFNRNGCIVDFQLSSSGKRAYYCLYRNSLTAYMHIGLMSLTL
jgi:hypothetical protein